MKKLKALGAILLIAVLTFVTLTQGLPYLMQLIFPTTGTIPSGSIEATWLDGTEVTSIDWDITENATAYTMMKPIQIANLYNVPIILNFHLQHLWLFLPESTILFGGLYIWNWSRTSQKKKQQKQAQTELRKLLQQASGGEKKK